MDTIQELFKIDFSYLFISVLIILISIKSIVSIFEWIIGKLGLETKWIRKNREEHELLMNTSKSLATLQEEHKKDVKESNEHDIILQNNLSEFMSEMKDVISETQKEIKQFAENRVHDREQSRIIQKELTDSIKNIVGYNLDKEKQIDNLMVAQREILADKINEKYKYYISIEGIPEDEFDEFTNLHKAYKGVGGNHSGDAKYEYCINHLQVIPVESKLNFNKDKI